MTTQELHEFLSNPEIFRENVLPAHSDHFYYESVKEADKGEMLLKQSLNGIWKFKYSKNLWERPEEFYKEDYDISKFDDIKVPGNIEMQGYGRNHYTNADYPWDGKEDLIPPAISRDDAEVGSYALNFKVDKNLKDKPLFISFQGVEAAFRVFVNGKYVGYSEDSFTPADFEITEFIHKGTNRLAVEVYKRCSGAWLEDQDMWRFYGIFREVYLYATPVLHVRDMFIKPLLDASYEKGVLDVNCEVTGAVKKASVELFDMAGTKTFEFPMEVSMGTCRMHLDGLSINKWSAEDPYLYEARINLYDDLDTLKEVAVTKIGFRSFELKDKLMLINGKRIIFKGTDRHEFSALNGRALTYEEMLWDIKTFKKNNINAVRTSHYPNQSIWYRLCDEYGIYVIDETNLETHGTWSSRDINDKMLIPGNKPEWKAAVVDRCNNMFMRDKNHASVLMWSLGNESFGGDDFIAMHDHLRAKDDTRIVHYEGTIHYRESEACSDVESKMYDKPADIRRYLENDPKKPFLSCEYMHAMGNSLGGMKLYTDLEDEFPMYQGGFIWDFVDQAIWQEHNGEMRLAYGGDFGDRSTEYCFCTDGLVFANRVESPKIKEAKNLYANVHLNATDSEITVENRNLFINLSRYYFVYTISENGKVVYTKTWNDINLLPYEKGTYSVEREDDLKPDCDYVFRLKMCEKNATKWADAGHEVAFAESVRWAKNNPVLLPLEQKEFKHISLNGNAKGALNEEFSVLFSRKSNEEGGMISLKDGEKELITLPPMPTFFRAYTDNDKGFQLGRKANYWHMLSRYMVVRFEGFEDKADFVEARYSYLDPNSEEKIAEVIYKVYPEKRIEVNLKYFGKEGRPLLPMVGWQIKLLKEYCHVEYFGKGPVENYQDRNNGVFTDIFTEDVEDNMTPYLVPQEVGNRTGVRYAKVTNDEGHGLLFAASEETFELGFLPYSEFELDLATHLDELPNINYSWIRIMAAQMGIGGDDTWGAPVHEEFCLDASKDYELNFEIRLI